MAFFSQLSAAGWLPLPARHLALVCSWRGANGELAALKYHLAGWPYNQRIRRGRPMAAVGVAVNISMA